MEPSHCFLPELWAQILSCLPVRSLLRCRSVCQEWKSTIDSGDFASLHLSRYSNNCMESRLVILEAHWQDGPRALGYSRCPDFPYYQPTAEIDFPVSPECLVDGMAPSIAGCVNGLLLVVRRTNEEWGQGDVLLWNPSIRKILNIPPPPSSKTRWFHNLFFGFDPCTNDYKVVVTMVPKKEDGRMVSLKVFSLNSNSWKRKGLVRHLYDLYQNRVFLGGSLYGVGFVFESGVGPSFKKAYISFSMTSQKFSDTPLPSYEHDRKRFDTPVLVAGSVVGLLTSLNGTSDIWVLENDGRWSKRFKIDTRMRDPSPYLGKDGLLIWTLDTARDQDDSDDDDGRVCLLSTKYILASDINTQGKSSLLLNRLTSDGFRPFYVGPYIESLVLLN